MQIKDLKKSKSIFWCLLSVLALSLLIFYSASAVQATPSNLDNENDESDESIATITKIRAKLHLGNLDTTNYDEIKIVGYLNGEGQIAYLDLKGNQDKIAAATRPFDVDLKFNQKNEVSSVMVDDEYFVCAYLVDSKNSYDKTNLPVYDCDEGNIGQSTTSDTVKLFSTMKKYNQSNTLYKSKLNSLNEQTPDDIKITVKIPLFDAKDIDDMNVVAMIKGEYRIKTIDVQSELNKGINTDQISVPFVFDRQTQSGSIQPGDLFFGCVTSDEFPNQNSDCEKRMLKDLDGLNSICARKDNKC